MRAFFIAAAALVCLVGTASALTPARKKQGFCDKVFGMHCGMHVYSETCVSSDTQGAAAWLTPADSCSRLPTAELAAIVEACNVTMPTPAVNATAYVGELKYANITGMDMAYLRFGNAESSQPPLILVPGYGSGMSTWPSKMLKDLASQHEVILIDNRGQGYSKDLDPNATLSIESMALDVKNVVEALNLTKPNLGGVSMGGMITLTSAALHGDTYNRFVVFSGSGGSKHSHRLSREITQVMAGVNVTIQEYLSLFFPIEYPEGGWEGKRESGRGLLMDPVMIPF